MEKLKEEEINKINEEFTKELKHLSNEILKTLFFINVLMFETLKKTIEITKGEEENERN